MLHRWHIQKLIPRIRLLTVQLAASGGTCLNSIMVRLYSGYKLVTYGAGEKPGILAGTGVGAQQHGGYGMDGCKNSEAMGHGLPSLFAGFGADGKIISKDNLLFGKLPVAAPWLPASAQHLLKDGHLNDPDGGTPSGFGHAPLYAHGNRLLIPGLSPLWCIGDPSVPYNGTAGTVLSREAKTRGRP